MHKASAIDATMAAQWRATAIEQLIQLGEAVLQEDPEQYPQLVAEAEKLTSKLDLAPERRDALFRSIRKRYADVARGNEVVGAKTKGRSMRPPTGRRIRRVLAASAP